MDQPFHDWGNQREGKGQDKAWWEVDSIVSGSYDGNDADSVCLPAGHQVAY